MFKSIQWKLVIVFVLLIIAMMIVLGTVMQMQITTFYHENFKQQMTVAFSDELIANLQMKSVNADSISQMNNELKAYAGRLGLNSNRNFYILDNTGTVLASDAEIQTGKQLDITDNIIAAIAGEAGDSMKIESPYLDYAFSIHPYIIYVRDDKNELRNMNETIFTIALQALLVGILISILLGFLLARTITKPIENLTKRAERLAQGDYDSRIEIKEKDEIGKLAITFNDMAAVIINSMTELSKEKNKVETIIQYMTDGVLAFGMGGWSIHINPAAFEMLGLSAYDPIHFDTFFKNQDVDISFAELIYLEHFKSVERDLNINDRHIKAYFAPFKIENEKTVGVVVVLQDATESLKMENMRREFVANVSHELRTPLTTIRSYAETLLDSEVEDREQSNYFLNVINREVDRMTRLVKDLLTLSKLDYDALEKTKHYFSLDELLNEVVSKLSIDAKNHRHTLTYQPTTKLPDLFADRDRIEQVITNIISNSIKYTPDGGKIEVFAGHIYHEIYIKIRDTGIGIPEKDLPRIFERFYRVDKARSREYGGTGLGLAIAQEIIALHNGSITLESQVGKGTEVLIKLPSPYN